MTTNTRTVLAVIVAALVSGGAAWYFAKQSAAPGTPPVAGAKAATPGGSPAGGPAGGPPAAAVEAAKVAVMALPSGITAVGSLRSDESITVRPEVVGRISQILFKEGERVQKGAALFRLDASVTAAEVAQARANLTLNENKFKRAGDLKEKGFISQQAVDEAVNNFKVAEAAAQLAQARYAKTLIQAPFSGIIGLRQVSVGDYVKEGQDLVNLEGIDPLKVDFRVPEVYMQQVQVGQSLQLTLDAFPNTVYEGRVFAINPLIDADGRAIVIRAQVKNAGAQLRPGMFTRVQLLFAQNRDSLVIPEQALIPVGDEKFVFRLVDGKAHRQKVDIGQRRDGKVEIVRGLAAGDTVVTAGQPRLAEGMAVRVMQSASVPAATPAAAGAAGGPGSTGGKGAGG